MNTPTPAADAREALKPCPQGWNAWRNWLSTQLDRFQNASQFELASAHLDAAARDLDDWNASGWTPPQPEAGGALREAREWLATVKINGNGSYYAGMTAEQRSALSRALAAQPDTAQAEGDHSGDATNMIPAPAEATGGWRLPEWNELTNEQRVAICDEGESWAFDRHLERDAACAIYGVIKEQVCSPSPPENDRGRG